MALDTYLGPPLAVRPPEKLTFKGPFHVRSRPKQTQTVCLKNPSMMQAALYKVKSTDKIRMAALPKTGVIGPDKSALITVTIARFQYNASEKNTEKLVVQSTLLKTVGFEDISKEEFNTLWREVPPRDLRENVVTVEFEEGDPSEVKEEKKGKRLVDETPKQRVMKSKRTLNSKHKQNIVYTSSSEDEEEVPTTRTPPRRSRGIMKKSTHTEPKPPEKLMWDPSTSGDDDWLTNRALPNSTKKSPPASSKMKDRHTEMELDDIPVYQALPSKSPDKKSVHFGGEEFFNSELKQLKEELLRKEMEMKQQQEGGYGRAVMKGTVLLGAMAAGGLLAKYVLKS